MAEMLQKAEMEQTADIVQTIDSLIAQAAQTNIDMHCLDTAETTETKNFDSAGWTAERMFDSADWVTVHTTVYLQRNAAVKSAVATFAELTAVADVPSFDN